MRESTANTEIVNALKAWGAWAYKIADMPHFAGQKTRFDIPKPCDIVGCYQGKMFAIETKLMKKPARFGFKALRPSQKAALRAIAAANGRAFIFLNVRMPEGKHKGLNYPRQDKLVMFQFETLDQMQGTIPFETLVMAPGMEKITLLKGYRHYFLRDFLKGL